MNDTKVFQGFEQSFLGRDLATEVHGCGKQELASLFVDLFRDHQPVLEGGCGSGKWLHYLKQVGITSIGLDWSQPLQAVSQAHDPTVQFDTGDLRDLPYEDESFGGVMALGSIEHVIEGPRLILQELFRVLRKGGVGLITVPYYSPVAVLASGLCGEPLRRLTRSPLLRKLRGKPPLNGDNPVSYQELRKMRFRRDIYLETDFDGFFFEYRFRPQQLTEELEKASFIVDRTFHFADDLGLLIQLAGVLKFGRLIGRYDRESEQVRFSPLGRMIASALPRGAGAHMLGAIIRK